MRDYIDREAFIEDVKTEITNLKLNGLKGTPRPCDELYGFIDRIKEQPSVDDVAPVVHGSWISWEEADNFMPSAHRHECSVCHDVAQVLVNGLELLSDYCPNCGAKMDEGGDKDDAD